MSDQHELSLEDVELLREKLLTNATQLVEEAELLFEAKRYARAYALAHLAREELVKLPMLVNAAFSAEIGFDTDWRHLAKRMRNHEEKIGAAHAMDYFFSDVRVDNSDFTDYKRALDGVSRENDLKNASLYAGWIDRKICAPSDVISPAMARERIDDARKRLHFFAESESATRGRIRELARRPESAAFMALPKSLKSP